MQQQKTLLHLTGVGGCPDFTALYEQYGYKVANAKTLRKALALIKQLAPSIIVAEFVYAPTYGSQLSNFESLFAAAQRFAPQAHFIAPTHRNDLAHLEKVRARNPRCSVLLFPVARSAMDDCLNAITASDPTLSLG